MQLLIQLIQIVFPSLSVTKYYSGFLPTKTAQLIPHKKDLEANFIAPIWDHVQRRQEHHEKLTLVI